MKQWRKQQKEGYLITNIGRQGKQMKQMEETAKRRLSDNKYRQTRKANETMDETAERRLSDNKYRQKRKAKWDNRANSRKKVI